MSRLAGAVLWSDADSEAGSTVLPDGCTDLIFDGTRLLVAGPDTVAFAVTESHESYIGLRLPSGAGPAAWGVPGSELVNQRVALADIWSPAAVDEMTARVAGSPDPGAELERIVVTRWRVRPPDPTMMDIAHALGNGTSVTSVAARMSLSARQLHRRSLFAYGYGPKTLARILRMNAALARARAGVEFAEVARDCGYADQAHFARDVRAFTGRTPTSLLAA